MWPPDQAWRAPVGDFPPPWASAWGDDPFGLWADLTVNGVTQRMRWIEPSGPEGFWLGSSRMERASISNKEARAWAKKVESDPRLVQVEQGFWLADTPCTQAMWRAVLGNDANLSYKFHAGGQYPVVEVALDEVEKFILRFAGTPEWSCEDRLGLPTEVQWEYAARAGNGTAYWWGNAINSSLANWNREHKGTTPVKAYPANPWGLFDMHGNVWERCVDVWRMRIDDSEAQPDPDACVLRGGSWRYFAESARSASRDRGHKGDRSLDQGFRFALRSSSHQGAEPQQGVLKPGGPAR